MATEKRLIDANAIPWEEYYVPDPDSNAQWDFKKEFSVLKPVVDQMPTVDAVEVVHGHWCWEGKFKACSQCGSYVEWDETLGANFWKFCPYCGAKMDGDGNG